jgi:hypothetical protein
MKSHSLHVYRDSGRSHERDYYKDCSRNTNSESAGAVLNEATYLLVFAYMRKRLRAIGKNLHCHRRNPLMMSPQERWSGLEKDELQRKGKTHDDQ